MPGCAIGLRCQRGWRHALERHTGWATTPAVKHVKAGIQAVAARLKLAGDGKPRVFFVRGALVERDQEWHEAKRPCCTVEEFDSYVWGKNDLPVKDHDHGSDALRYLAMTLEGDASDHGQDEVYRA